MKIGIFGASGFSREVADICLEIGYSQIVFIDYNACENDYFGFPLVDETEVKRLVEEGYKFIIGVGDNKLRKKIYNKFPNLKYVNVIHPSATFGNKQLNEVAKKSGNIITAGVRFTNNIILSNFGIYNLNCTIGHDCDIGDFVNVAPGANISGNIFLSEGVYVGTNASIIQGHSINEKLIIGRNSIIGAGSVVTKSVSNNVIVKGIPAK